MRWKVSTRLRELVAAVIRWLCGDNPPVARPDMLAETWRTLDRSVPAISIPDHVRDREGMDLRREALEYLSQIRSDVQLGTIYYDVSNKMTTLYLRWVRQAAVAILFALLPTLAFAQFDADEPLELIAAPVTVEEAPPRPESPAEQVVIPADVIHATMLQVLALPETTSAQQPTKRKVTAHGAPWCGFCQIDKREWAPHLAAADSPVEVTYTDGPLPAWAPAGQGIPFYVITDADGPKFWGGSTNWQTLQARLQANPPKAGDPKLVGLTWGAVKGKEQVGQALKLLSELGPGRVTVTWQVAKMPRIGTADGSLEVNRSGAATYEWSSDRMHIGFDPPLRLVAGTWLGPVNQPVTGAEITRDKFTLEMPGMLDLSKRLE